MGRKISSNLTDENYNKIKKRQELLNKDSVGKVNFEDALNDMLGELN